MLWLPPEQKKGSRTPYLSEKDPRSEIPTSDRQTILGSDRTTSEIFENAALPWRHENHVISLTQFSSKPNSK